MENGKICETRNSLIWVFSKREKPKHEVNWENDINTHKLGNFYSKRTQQKVGDDATPKLLKKPKGGSQNEMVEKEESWGTFLNS